MDPDGLDWKPQAGNNWMTVGQLLKHITQASGAACQPPGGKFEDLTPEEALPPADKLPALDSVEEAKKLVLEDRALALRVVNEAGEDSLANTETAAPWAPVTRYALGRHLLQMVQHLDRHKAQLQGKPVNTEGLWG